MAFKSREELLKLAERRFTEIDGIRIQSLTELELSNLEAIWGQRYQQTQSIDMKMRRELMVRCIVDGDGNRLFADDEVDLLAGLDGAVSSKLYRKCREHCGMDREDDTEKN